MAESGQRVRSVIAYLMQSYADLPRPPAYWLSAAEQFELSALRVPKRRQDWLLGRWTAKCLLQATVAGVTPLAMIQINPARGHAPLARWPGGELPCPLSISHCSGRAVAALVVGPHLPLGIDLERIEARPTGFANDYFTASELACLRHNPEAQTELVTAIWCAKEAALKALGLGLTVDTRAVNVGLHFGSGGWRGWRRLSVELDQACLSRVPAQPCGELSGWWCRSESCLLAVVLGTAAAGSDSWPVAIQTRRCQEIVA